MKCEWGGGRDSVRIWLGRKYPPLYKKAIKKTRNKSMETAPYNYWYKVGNLKVSPNKVPCLHAFLPSNLRWYSLSLGGLNPTWDRYIKTEFG